MNARLEINRKIMRFLCLLIVLLSGITESKGQNKIYKVFLKSEWQQHYDSLKHNFGQHKKLINEFELQSLIALSYYPELKNVPITFCFYNIRTTAEVRPEYFSAFKNSNRKYVVYISKNVHTEGVLLKDVSFNAQIGVIGHELAHILDYEGRTVSSLFGLAFNYLVIKNHAKYERSIDELAIKRGLGWQELEFADFMQNRSNATEKYKHFKQINYMSSSEIEAEIAKMKLYSSFQSPKKMTNSINEKQ
jgi:hypothetical protein